jgi:hypothetical protein
MTPPTVSFFGGELEPMTLSPERGQFDTGTSLEIHPPETFDLDDSNEHWRGFLTHFITPALKEQRLRAGFTKIALKGVHASDASVVRLGCSIYIVDDEGEIVKFLWDKDQPVSRALAESGTVPGVVLIANVPTTFGDIPEGGRIAVEIWVRQVVTDYGGNEGVGAEFFLEGADESMRATVGGDGEYDTTSVASYVDFAQELELVGAEPVFAVRIDPIGGMKHTRLWSTDVIPKDDASEQRVKLRTNPNHVAEFIAVGHDDREMQLMDSLIEKLTDRPVWLPWWRDEQTLPFTLAEDAITLDVATEGYMFRAGGRAIIWQDPFTWEVVNIEAVGDTSLIISTGLERDWVAGTASIMPLMEAVMLGSIKIDREAANYGAASVAFSLSNEEVSGHGVAAEPVVTEECTGNPVAYFQYWFLDEKHVEFRVFFMIARAGATLEWDFGDGDTFEQTIGYRTNGYQTPPITTDHQWPLGVDFTEEEQLSNFGWRWHIGRTRTVSLTVTDECGTSTYSLEIPEREPASWLHGGGLTRVWFRLDPVGGFFYASDASDADPGEIYFYTPAPGGLPQGFYQLSSDPAFLWLQGARPSFGFYISPGNANGVEQEWIPSAEIIDFGNVRTAVGASVFPTP